MDPSDTAIKLIVFDMAGTTVHDEDFVHQALADALKAAGFETTRDDINAVMGYPKPDAILSILKDNEVPADQLDTQTDHIHSDFVVRMNRFYETHPAVREIEGASDTFRALKNAGVFVGLDTGFGRTTADTIIKRLGWMREGLIDATVTSDEVDKGRPFPYMIQRLMELTGVDSISAVAKVGDTPSDLLEGDQAGCPVNIGVTYGSHTSAELEAYPHTHLVNDIAEIPALLGI